MKKTTGAGKQQKTTAVNWQELRRRLGASHALGEKGWERTPEEKRELLKARAQALARRTENRTPVQERIEVVEFLLAYERYALETRYVREVYPLKELALVPCAPRFVLGVINVRGQILSVIDIKKLFDLPEKGLTDLNKAILVQSGRMQLGILADAILGVREIAAEDLQPSLPTLTGIRAEYLLGVTKERLVVLDVCKVLSDSTLVVQEEVRT